MRVRVTGLVQGVGYRYSTSAVAARIGVSGWVRNRRDGSVEAEIEGTPAQVDDMIAWMRKGPPSAAVQSLDAVALEAAGSTTFEVLDDA